MNLAPSTRPGRLSRSASDRMLLGVAGGVGHRWGVDTTVVRLGFLVLTLAGGVGAILYLLGWVLADDAVDHPVTARTGTTERSIAVGLFVVAALLLLRDVGLWPGDDVMWPATMAAVGSGLLWARTSPEDRARLSSALRDPQDSGRLARWLRWLVGGLLVLIGLGAVLLDRVRLSALADVGIAIIVTTVAAGILLGPWLARVVRDLGAERRERVRAEERERIAAHLHDGVLQTFALMQRAADDPRRMATLARRQERELRAWLYEGRDLSSGDAVDLRSALEQVAQEVEDLHGLRVDVVIVGDSDLDERATSLIAAIREALTNVGKHAGTPDVSLYVEVDEAMLSAWVRDRGNGFDPSIEDHGGRGIADSIVGRLRRLGGTAELHSTPGEGTEVVMEVPR